MFDLDLVHAYASQAPQCPTSSSSAARNKRGLDEDEDDETEAVAMETEAASSESSAAESSKRTKVEDESGEEDILFPHIRLCTDYWVQRSIS